MLIQQDLLTILLQNISRKVGLQKDKRCILRNLWLFQNRKIDSFLRVRGVYIHFGTFAG